MTCEICTWCLGRFDGHTNYVEIQNVHGRTFTICQGCWERQPERIADALGRKLTPEKAR